MSDNEEITSRLMSRLSRSVYFSCLLIVFIFLALFLEPNVSSQQGFLKTRLIDEKYSYADCPVKIIEVENIGHKLDLHKTFSDSDDWLNGLTVRVKNVSDKTVTHVGIKITFDRPKNQSDQPRASWDIWYGVSPFYFKTGEPLPSPSVRLIRPGETELIFLTETDYKAMCDFLKEVGFPTSITSVHISVYTIGFEDGTAWGGQLYRRDPRSPGGWKPADKPRGSALRSTAFSFLNASYQQKVSSIFDVLSVARPVLYSRLLPTPDTVPCGSALIATAACPNNQSGCNYDFVGQLDTENPNKPDSVDAQLVRCYVFFKGQKFFGCGNASSPVPVRIPCPSATPSPTPTPTPVACSGPYETCVTYSDCCYGLSCVGGQCQNCSPKTAVLDIWGDTGSD
jgi:hypothetical protein